MNNPYYVEPLGGFDFGQAAQMIGTGLGARQQRLEKEQMQQAKQAQMQEASRLFREGTPMEQADFILKNPGLRDQFMQAQGFASDQTRMARLDGVKRILAGENPETVINETAQSITDAGGDPSDTLALLSKTPEQIKRAARINLTFLDPKAAKAYAEAMPEKGQGFTLSEGQGRYDDQGQLVAYMPKQTKTLENELKVEKDKFDKAAKLRGEVEKVSKVYRDVEDSYGRIEAAVTGEPTGATDMALIFNYMKMLDPGSTVREGEFATAAQTGGIPAYTVNLYNKAVDGQMLTKKQRDNFIAQAKEQFNKATDKHKERLGDYETLGQRFGLERGDIIVSDVKEPEYTGVDKQAYDWAKANPNDPRSAQILKKLESK